MIIIKLLKIKYISYIIISNGSKFRDKFRKSF